MIGTLLWRPHLGTLAGSFVILLLMGWLWLLYRRYRSLYSIKRAWVLMAPKILFTLLLLVAIFDPCWRVVRPADNAQQVALLTDISSSMQVEDGESGSRAERARRIARKFESEFGDWVEFKNYGFDVDVRDHAEKTGEEIRGTDIGRTVVSLSQRPELSVCKAAVILTDGGDEAVAAERMPSMPIYIVGVGSEPSTWNDVSVDGADVPAEIEANTPFKVTAQLLARSAGGDFSVKMEAVEVVLEKREGDMYKKVDSRTVDLRQRTAFVEFEVPGEEKEGSYAYRLAVEPVEGEITALNNERTFEVGVREKKIYVLLYGRVLDWSYALLRRTLEEDPSISLTSLYYKNEDVLRLEGSRQEGDEVLSRGFPEDKKVLDLYRCVILGSFPAENLGDACYQALKEYVEGGGSVIFMGGAHSFGSGGYAGTPVAPLIPWQINDGEPKITAGQYPVMVPPEGQEHSLMSATADLLQKASSPMLYSINYVGRLRSGAIGLANASAGAEIIPVVALQSYGRGQTLGLATDTLWRWGRMGGDLSGAYEQFWRDATRYMCGVYEGGRFLTAKWDRERYRPSEEAVVDIRIAGRYAAGEISLKGSVRNAGGTQELSIDPIRGEDNVFRTKVFFPERGDYAFALDAMAGGESLDTYQRTLHVGSALNEGAELPVDHAFLESLAGRAGGYYEPEEKADAIIERLKAKIVASASPHDLPLVREPDILFGTLPVYVLAAMAVLVGEWTLRRRMNMM